MKMGENEKAVWGRASNSDLPERWPRDERGEPEEPVFLCNCRNLGMLDELRINMLEGYGIPCLKIFPGNGTFGRLVLGFSGQGTDIYVPKSLYQDAVELCKEEKHEEL